MEGVKPLRSWREILKDVNPHQKQEMAQGGLASVRTIDRWISGQSNPQKRETIRELAHMSDEMLEALKSAFPEAFQETKPAATNLERVGLPLEFYRRVTHAYARVPLSSRRWTIWHLVANQMLPHLDMERSGLVLVSVRATPETNVLLFGEGAGNTCWTTRQITQSSIPGDPWLVQAVAEGRPFFLPSCVLSQVFPPSCLVNREQIQSMGFFPLYRAGVAGGGLLLCSTQEDFFTPLRQDLIAEYACLFAFAFSDSDFPSP